MKTCEMPTFKGCTEQMELTQASERKQPGTQGQKKMSTWHQEMQEQKQFHEGLSSPQGKTCREVKKIKGQKPSVTCSRKSLRQERHVMCVESQDAGPRGKTTLMMAELKSEM